MNASSLATAELGSQIERYGSYCGYAAIVGLGVLALLYFAQAREVKRLREWAGRAPERDAELAQRVQSDAQRRVVSSPVAAAAPASPQTAAAQSADAARKAAAAAVLQKLQPPGMTPAPAPKPAVGPPGSLARTTPAAGAPGTAPAPAVPGATPPAPGVPAATAGPAAAQAPGTPAPSTPPGATGASPSPAAVAPGKSGLTAGAAAARQTPAPSRSPASTYANGAGGQDTRESDAARPAPMPDLPPRRSATAAPPEKAGSSRRRVGAIVAGVLALLVVGAVLVIVLHSGGVAKPPAGNEIGNVTPPPAASPSAAATSTKVNRAGTQVAVLNGTTTTGLARGVADKLEKSGFTIIKVGDNADQALSATTISYSGGNVAAARAVARIIGVGNAAVRPTDTNTSVAVGPKAKVVVLVGNDRSSTG